MHMSDKETVMMSERDGNFYILVDGQLVLRCSSKRIVEYYYNQFTSDAWQGPRLVVPEPSVSTDSKPRK